eukprot:TRINITY_DN2508_c0_g1_i1.p1 TRINITY_DN2508_c0_g1~~TRINITY_DN2508_c0_g1_i1.p1  ORF type:complete len:396 (-),score=98.87 TRINITY_DN2508_c0_g1_i1:317-1504(-)
MSAYASAEEQGWERSDFPVVCETCLGDNPYVRMTKADWDKECKVCTRPFTVFRWRAGTKGRYKKTEICQTCAKMKNVCQTCLLDLKFNLPVQVRDSALPSTSMDQPISEYNREYQSRLAEKAVGEGNLSYLNAQYNPLVNKLARQQPYYERNKAHICSFFVKGNCNRGAACPFRHEKPPEQGDLANQNIKDRYYGVNDPVAKKMMSRLANKEIQPPEDKDVKTLYVGNVDNRITEQDLRDHFYHFGEIKSVKMNYNQHCSFIEFTTREATEKALKQYFNHLIINGVFLKLSWAKPHDQSEKTQPAPPINYDTSSSSYYPSMDPSRLGAPIENPDGASTNHTSPSSAPPRAPPPVLNRPPGPPPPSSAPPVHPPPSESINKTETTTTTTTTSTADS